MNVMYSCSLSDKVQITSYSVENVISTLTIMSLIHLFLVYSMYFHIFSFGILFKHKVRAVL